ncbi:MAG: ATP-binding cassette domain-containing protein [Clostridium sp.]
MYKSILNLLDINKGINKKFITAYFMGLVYMIMLLIPAEIIKNIIYAIETKNKVALYNLLVYSIFTVVGTIIVIYFERILLISALNTAEKNIQFKLLDNICKMKKKKFQSYPEGKIMTQITQNVTEAITKGFEAIYSFFVGLLGLTFILSYMLYLSIELMLAIAIFNVIVIFITSAVSKQLKNIHQNVIQLNNTGNQLLIDLIDNSILIRLFEKNGFFSKIYRKNEHDIYQANLRVFAIQNGINEFIWGAKKIAEITLIFGIGGYLVNLNKIDISVIASYTLISDIFTKNLSLVVNSIFSINKAIPSINAIIEVLKEEDLERESDKILDECKGDIRFENVSFRHGEQKILKRVSFSISAGDKVMIVGENGQGKSTLLNLIAGMYRPDEGDIFIGKYNTRDININSIANLYCYISQKPHILIGDSYQNLALTNNYNKKVCQKILHQLRIENIAKDNPQLYSEGEKQRLCIGRALYRGTQMPIILGDEIFANIDKDNKKNISKLLFTIFKNKTVIMVCHDNSYLNFNKKLIVDNGKIELVNIRKE